MNANALAIARWSPQQERIFDWFSGDESEHLVVRARAGTGKSTTIREAAKRSREAKTPGKRILICAFSKPIQLAMEQAIGTFPNGRVQTLHSVGLACVKRFRERLRIQFNSERADDLARKVCGNNAPDAILKLVSKLHTKGREIAPHAKNFGDLTNIGITFECEPEEQWAASGFDFEYVETKALEAMELASAVQSGETIDGSDMIFLPVRNGWMTREFDLVIVDEAQDMTTAQLEIALGVLRKGGRVAVVGDDKQAIFGFRGADSEALDRLKAELGATELGLTTTYRCGKAIVELAKELVPDFEAGPDNPEGEILTLPGHKLIETAAAGDFILSRVNAPLVSIAMKLLRSGKRTRVMGRNIGDGLRGLIRKLKGRTVPDLLGKIEGWAQREIGRLEVQHAAAKNGRKATIEAKMEAIRDQADMLISLTDGAKSVNEVETRIEALFTDDEQGVAGMITCSSVHRAKGLEANRVFVLKDTIRYNTQEEINIAYVAITRAKNTLVWVTGDRGNA